MHMHSIKFEKILIRDRHFVALESNEWTGKAVDAIGGWITHAS